MKQVSLRSSPPPLSPKHAVKPMDFDHILDAVDVSIEPFALCEIKGNSSLGLGRRPHATLHYFLAGEGTVSVSGHKPIPAVAGSVILVPAYAEHSIRASGIRFTDLPKCHPLDVSIEHIQTGTGKGTLAAICGKVSVVYRGLSGTMDLLNAPIIEALEPDDRVRTALDELINELASPQIGTRALARALLLQCIILLFRRRLQVRDKSLSWMRGLADEGLWAAVRAMLDHPEQPHTVDVLAECVGMSRAAFAKRFSVAYGTGPIDMLRTVRLRRAAELLVSSSIPVKRVAQLVGYDSRTYFSRAFKEEHGIPPEAFRRNVTDSTGH